MDDDSLKSLSGSGALRDDLKNALRRRFFAIYYEIMKERNLGLTTVGIFFGINFFQIYGLLYDSKIAFPFNGD